MNTDEITAERDLLRQLLDEEGRYLLNELRLIQKEPFDDRSWNDVFDRGGYLDQFDTALTAALSPEEATP